MREGPLCYGPLAVPPLWATGVPVVEQEGWGGGRDEFTRPGKQGPRLRSRVVVALPPLRPGSHDGRRGQVTSVCAVGEKEIRPARAAGRPQASRAGTRRHHKPIRAIRLGSGGTVRPRQDEGRPPHRSLRVRWRSISGGPEEPRAPPFLTQHGTFERRPRLRVMAAVPSSLSRFLPVCRALPDAALPMCLRC
ncbi:hypothetical protein NDU88_005826 [Pleurodeles waltl]|uniref:Uncharacterized protein n=1 Tax=Pleurodeles waltl TaxID=8319 RepID=A0AAV7RJS5_PLEWA|nr:hypothetical protein NDU88_005826 [Pleurodeles waltl]